MKAFKFIIIFIILLSLPILFVKIDSSLHKKEISIAVADVNGSYYAHALEYKKLLKQEGVDVKIVTTQGSIETQQKLLKKEVDFGFIQGGTEVMGEGLLSLANIAYEPVWIFYNDKNVSSLGDLLAKKVAIGGEKSGIYPVAKMLLLANEIDKNNTKLLHLPSKDASYKLQNGTIDAMFYVASLDAKLVQNLLKKPDISLLDFEKAAAYKQYFLKNHEDFHILKLNAGGFDIKQHIPKKDHTLLAKKTILATFNATEPMSRLLLKVAWQVHKHSGVFHDEHTFPNDKMLKLDQHRASVQFFKDKEHFYEELFDFWTAQSLNSLHNFGLLFLIPLLTLYAFFVEVIVPTMHWYARRKIIVWYDKINVLDTDIESLTLKETKYRKKQLENILREVRELDDIPATHMEEFYSLQNQIANISDDLQRHITILNLK